MGKAIITVNNVWKQYKLGDINAGSLKEELHLWWNKNVLGRANNKSELFDGENILSEKSDEAAFWALQEINFEAQQGEALGIIGKNGAGKSTLLKILSRVTRPTRGSVKGHGRIASMLEVGTGFHDELTGRENIFLNGNILGMSNNEIKRKFDSIVDFSGIARFIDTPVKRYSSGMYVRLAFSIAAHLEPDILLLDEVLTVGDMEFQEKCLKKMKEIIAERGCTILFVSHNVNSVLELCNRAILLNKGKIAEEGDTKYVVNNYYKSIGKRNFYQRWDHSDKSPGNEVIRIQHVSLKPEFPDLETKIDVRTPLHISIGFINSMAGIDLSVGIHLFTTSGDCICDIPSSSKVLRADEYECSCTIPGNFLNDGDYYISVIFVKDTNEAVYYLERCLSFEVADYRGEIKWQGKWIGAVRPSFPIHITKK